jgi:hypothetical protein
MPSNLPELPGFLPKAYHRHHDARPHALVVLVDVVIGFQLHCHAAGRRAGQGVRQGTEHGLGGLWPQGVVGPQRGCLSLQEQSDQGKPSTF